MTVHLAVAGQDLLACCARSQREGLPAGDSTTKDENGFTCDPGGDGDSCPSVFEPSRLLSEDEVRQLLRECVTVVKPGETLILRCGRDWTPAQMREIQDSVNAVAGYRDLSFKVLVVPADELGVAEPWRTEPRSYEYPVGGAGGHE